MKLGLSGAIAQRFQNSEITPLLALVGLLMGVFAVLITPREEEPQIDVTFANVFIAYPGASAREIEQVVSTPVEQILDEIEGVEHVYSISRPGLSALTVQFEVGQPRTEALVRLYNKLYSNQDFLPDNLGVLAPIIKPKGIDDVPIVSITLWTPDPTRGAFELGQVAHALEAELKRVAGTRDIYTIGAPEQVVEVRLDPARLAGHGLALDDLRQALLAANASTDAGQIIANNRSIALQAGSFLVTPEQIAELVVGLHNGTPVYLADVADISYGAEQPQQYVWFATGTAWPKDDNYGDAVRGEHPAVTLAIAKKPGENAVLIADQLVNRLEQLRGALIPDGIEATVTRNYGITANDKAQTLIKKLIFATSAVIVLVLLALGWREALIVGTAVIITLTITLFASWAYGFTLNRVSLFALIFSIGILVDDAIVVVENIHRHIQLGGKSLLEAIPLAVDEVGGPTILATLTVIAALLPMAFVTGLMGPYMSPIPINASMGMLISLAVAFIFTPWLAYKILRNARHQPAAATPVKNGDNNGEQGQTSFGMRLFRGLLSPFLGSAWWRFLLGIVIVTLIGASISLAYQQWVVLKMLPFDNKSEFQVIVDMPEGTPVEQTARVLGELGRYIATVPEVTDYQAYAGTAAPINFNGLVRQYYLRSEPHMGDLQVNLTDKHLRNRKSHDIARSVRDPLQAIGAKYDANVKVVEVPPGPPVMSPLVAEIYGPDYQGQIETARNVRALFAATPDIIDIDDTVEAPAERLIVHVDRVKAALLGVSQQQVAQDLYAVLHGENVSFVHTEAVKYPAPIRLEFSPADKADLAALLALKLRARSGALVRLSELVSIERTQVENAIYHKDLLPVVFVFGDMAGTLDSPLYGMAEMATALDEQTDAPTQYLIQQPADRYSAYSLKWDGEWQITYETFRDMGIAYSVGLILIYLLVVAQFRSYLTPLIIMAPIPLTIIGVLPGHALIGAQFTATSMIGMIALAGIIVRNSILLVDFINLEVANGVPFRQALIHADAVRAKPILLTALAAMLGALFILDDPIFQGLAISLIFGILVSTVLTLLVIPVLYYAAMRRRLEQTP